MTTTPKYVFTTLLAVAFTFLFHESCHWLAGEALGYEMVMTLNTAYPKIGAYREAHHYTLISAVGPLATLLQALIVWALLRRKRHFYLFPFLLTPFYLELLSGVMNLSKPNDLGRIGQSLGIGLLTLSFIAVGLHTLLVYTAARKRQLKSRFIGGTFLWVLLFSSVWILTNMRFSVVLIP